MCLDCIKQLEPPTPDIARARLYLQLLAGGLFIVSLFALLAGEMFTIFFMLILGFILYMSWSSFSFEMTLNFILICTIEVITVYVELIGLLEYYDEISSSNSAQVLFIIVKLLYYPNAIFFSHEAYKKFKQHSKYSFQKQSPGDYQMMPMGQPQPPQNTNGRSFMPFQGQGTSIG